MEEKTIKQLREEAKCRGLRGFWKLKKAELVELLEPPRNVMDDAVPDIGVPVLQPQPFTPRRENPSLAKRFQDWASRLRVKKKLKIWADWLVKWVSPKPNKINSVLEAFKQKVDKLFQRQQELTAKNQRIKVCPERVCKVVYH